MLRYLSADIICSLLGTDNIQGQIFEHIFAQMAAIVFIIPFKFFRIAHSLGNWGIYIDCHMLRARYRFYSRVFNTIS